MRKLRLDVDELQVEAFETVLSGARRSGTVRGHDWTQYAVYTCVGQGCAGFTDGGCGFTPYCPGYGCTQGSTCAYPTAVYDACPPGWTNDEPECWVVQPRTYYCGGSGGDESGGANC